MTTVLIPGSFDPLHLGHVDIVEQAVELFGDVRVEKFSGLAVQAASQAGADFIVKGLRNPADFDIEQQMAHMNHAAAGVRTVFLPCRPNVVFVSSRFIREIAAHGGAIDHLVPKPVAVALADRFPPESAG
jgi:pantetheine-phosphate adenylyltransferase